MNFIRRATTAFAAIAVMSVVGVVACSTPTSGEGLEDHGAEGEESGVRYDLDEVYDETRSGARLILRYDRASSTFVGTAENTTNGILRRVRVEVHLSNGVELGPTAPVDLDPGQMIDITLSATGQSFTWWSAHPEVG